MEALHIAAALLSALLHAGWNAGVKASADPAGAMTAQSIAAALIVLPALAFTGLPPPAAWPWIGLSALCSLATVSALLKAYETGGFGTVYPLSRALAVLIVVPLVAIVGGEWPSLSTLAGIALIASSLALIAFGLSGDASFPPSALGWTLAAGISAAIYVLADAQGVRAAASPWAYGIVLSVLNAVLMSLRQRALGSPATLLFRHWQRAVPCGAAAVISYLLILFVFTVAPIAPAAALRDTSALFAILIAVFLLKEPFGRLRLLAVLLAALAVPLLRLG